MWKLYWVLISSHRDIIVLIQWYYSTEITITDPDKQQKHIVKKEDIQETFLESSANYIYIFI